MNNKPDYLIHLTKSYKQYYNKYDVIDNLKNDLNYLKKINNFEQINTIINNVEIVKQIFEKNINDLIMQTTNIINSDKSDDMMMFILNKLFNGNVKIFNNTIVIEYSNQNISIRAICFDMVELINHIQKNNYSKDIKIIINYKYLRDEDLNVIYDFLKDEKILSYLKKYFVYLDLGKNNIDEKECTKYINMMSNTFDKLFINLQANIIQFV